MVSEVKYFEDISPEEEANLPLPGDWMRTIQSRPDGVKFRVYKNIKTGQEIDEHPIISRAMNVARKLPLPLGWCTMETRSEQDQIERFYYNADLQLSLWDPPMLRSCLADYLKVLGFDLESIGFRSEIQPPGYGGIEEHKSPLLSPSDGHGVGGSLLDRFTGETKMSLLDLDQPNSTNENIPPPPTSPEPWTDTPVVREAVQFAPPQQVVAAPSETQLQPQQQTVPPPRDWERLLNIYKEPILPFSEKISHRADELQPPVTWAGVKILRGDVREANERIHHLISRIRSMLATKRGYKCSFLYHDSASENDEDQESESSSTMKTAVTLASDIVTTLRQQPELVVMAIATNNNTIGSTAMLQASFVALHRLLHPFSTDYSMTTALLLQSINYQLEELAAVEQIFCHMDSKMIIPRALSIYDPVMAVQWNPVDSPLPMIPNVQSETVFACLMRVYSIRRDVTAFFRAVWKPVLPAIATLLQLKESPSNPVVLENLISLAYRLLENTFHEKSMTVFPITATAVCRAVYEIGGQTAMVALIYNFLILPNLVKILGGDHDSLENEDVYRVETASKVINRYFDCTWWLQNDSKESAKLYKSSDDRPLVVLKSFLWTVWRLFSCSLHLSETAISAITVPEFIQGRLSFLNCTGIKDHKLRNLLARVNRKVSHGCNWLVQMPLDVHGNSFLGVEHQDLDLDGVLTMNHETHELLDRRMSSLAFKPGEMLNATVVSKYELCGFLSDVGCAMDDHDFPTDSPIYRGIADFLSVYGNNQSNNNNFADEHSEEFITLTFLYTNHGENEEDSTPHTAEGANQESVVQEHRQLLCGLKLLNRYEDTLLNLIRKVDNGVVSNIYELLSDATGAWYLEPEFDTEFKVNHIEIAEKHTDESRNKVRFSYHGVKQSRPVQVFPLFSQHNTTDHHPNNKSLKELQKDFFQSFRFGSAQQSVAVGTSLARQKVLPPKVERGQIKVTTLSATQLPSSSHYAASEASSRGSQNYRSLFTEPTIKPNSSILVPTKSFLNMKNALPVTPMDLDKNFMKSMRDHQVISTEEFQMRYFRRRNQAAKSIRRDVGDRLIHGGTRGRETAHDRKIDNAAASAAKPPPAPKPFPAHLRYLIRHDDGDHQSPVYGTTGDESFFKMQEELYDDEDIYGDGYGYGYGDMHGTELDGTGTDVQYFPQPYQSQMIGEDHSQFERQSEAWKYDPNYFRSLIQDYQATIQPVTTGHQYDDFVSTAAMLSSQLQGKQLDREQSRPHSRSPTLPVPLDNSGIWSPTKSYSQKHQIPIRSDAFMRDLHEGKPPELRHYHDEIPAVVHEEPFSPTKNKIYQSNGGRAPRVPEFLAADENEEIEDSMYATSVSRDSTPHSRRGRRSRSTSPAASTRSRSGSYAKPTFASIQQLSDRTYSLRGEQRPDFSLIMEHETNKHNSPRSSLSSSPTARRRKRQQRPINDDPQMLEMDKPEDVIESEAEVAISAKDFLHHSVNPPVRTMEVLTETDPPLVSILRLRSDQLPDALDNPSLDRPLEVAEEKLPPPPPNTEVTGVRVIKKKIKLSQSKPSQPYQVEVDRTQSLQATPPPNSRRQFVGPNPAAIPIQLHAGNSHKQTFAEAIASVVSEAAASTANGPHDSTYSLNFSPDADHERTTTNLREDREKALARRRELLQRQDSDSEIDEVDKYLEFKTGPSLTNRRAKSERMKSSKLNTDGGEDTGAPTENSPSRVPIMKRKSLIKNFSTNKEMFLNGFYAKKVSDFFFLNKY